MVKRGELGPAGRVFWQEMQDAYELDERESVLLVQAAKALDRIALLEVAVKADGVMATGSTGQTVVHPAVAEIRQQQLAVQRLLGALRLPDDVDADARFVRARASAGAQERWSNAARSRRAANGQA